MEATTIKEAPNYRITKKGTVESIKSGKAVAVTKRAVRLTIDGSRKTFKVDELVKQYFPEKEKPATKKLKVKGKTISG